MRAGASGAEEAVRLELCRTARGFHARGWMLGTSGNLSGVLSAGPLRLAITPSGAEKGELEPGQIVTVDASGTVVAGAARASDETVVHLAIVRGRGAGAVAHTHSVWNNLAAELGARDGGLALEGFEMLKGLAGVASHEHREWVPVLENTQDYALLESSVSSSLAAHPRAHAVLLRRHGLYTWGRDVSEARRHVEILEFLFELTGRMQAAGLADREA